MMCRPIFGMALTFFLVVSAPPVWSAQESRLLTFAPRVDNPLYSVFDVTWPVTRTALRDGVQKDALFHLDALHTEKINRGVENMFVEALVVLRAAVRAHNSGEGAYAHELVVRARKLAPDLPEAHFVAGSFYVSGSAPAPGRAATEYISGVKKLWSFLPDRQALVANAAGLLMILLLFAIGAFSLGVAIRYVRLLAYDIRIRLPGGISSFQALLVVLLLLFLPFASGLGAVYVALLWSLAFWAYMHRSERMVAMFLVAGIAALPWLNRLAVSAGSAERTWGVTAYQCALGLCGEDEVEHLGVAAKNADAALAQEALARYNTKAALADPERVSPAEVHVARALGVLPGAASVHALHATLLFSRAGRLCESDPFSAKRALGEARAAYNQALQRNPQDLASLYNQSILVRLLGEEGEADFLFATAQAVDREALYEFEQGVAPNTVLEACPIGFNANRYLMSPPVDVTALAQSAMHAPTDADTVFMVPFHRVLTGSAGHRTLPVVAVMVLVAMIALLPLLGGGVVAWFCGHCGNVASQRACPQLQGLDICETCLIRTIRGTAIDPKAQFFTERRTAQSAARKVRAVRAVSIFFPGFGHLLWARAVTGTAILLAMAILALLVVHPEPIVESAYRIRVGARVGVFWSAGAIAVIVYISALFSAFGLRMRRRG